jgi:hypothetical protein
MEVADEQQALVRPRLRKPKSLERAQTQPSGVSCPSMLAVWPVQRCLQNVRVERRTWFG